MCGKSIFLNQLLSFTALNGHLQICQLIARYIVEIPWRGYIPFHFAAKKGHLDVCLFFLDCLDGIHPKDGEELDLAARFGQLDTLQMIIGNIEDKYEKTKELRIALLKAAQNGQFQICQWIVGQIYIKNPDESDYDYYAYENATYQKTLDRLAKKDHLNIFKLIVRNIKDENEKTKILKFVLLIAAENGHFEMCQWIIGQIKDKNPDHFHTDENVLYKKTVDLDAKKGHLDILQLLVKSIMRGNQKTKKLKVALLKASENGQFEICQLTLGQIDVKNSDEFYGDFYEDKNVDKFFRQWDHNKAYNKVLYKKLT